VEVPIPEISADEILLKIKSAAVCGTDIRMWTNGQDGVDEKHPVTLCHEFSGIIDKIGKNVDSYKVGQRVAIAPNIGCGFCDNCIIGNSHFCNNLKAFGIHLDGGFAEYIRITKEAIRGGNIMSISDSTSFNAAAVNEAFSCTYNAFEHYNIFPGDTVLIIGAGAIGLMHAKLAFMAGAYKVIMNDLSKERLLECKKRENRIIIKEIDLYETVMKETDNEGVNVVITACSVKEVQETAFQYAALNGRVNFFGGLPKGQKVKLDTNEIHYKQLMVSGTTRSSHRQYKKTLEFVSKKLVDLDAIITDEFKIEDGIKAFENAKGQKGLKQVIVF
jgi:L-iditol 2-dehydrogenase